MIGTGKKQSLEHGMKFHHLMVIHGIHGYNETAAREVENGLKSVYFLIWFQNFRKNRGKNAKWLIRIELIDLTMRY